VYRVHFIAQQHLVYRQQELFTSSEGLSEGWTHLIAVFHGFFESLLEQLKHKIGSERIGERLHHSEKWRKRTTRTG